MRVWLREADRQAQAARGAVVTWVLIRSWHGVKTPTRVPGRFRTFCGRTAFADPVDVLPGGKSCESCLRIIARKADSFQAVAEPAEDRLAL